MKIIDTYALRQFIATLFFALVALCLIFLVVNLLENLDEFMDNEAGFGIIVNYYVSYFPEILTYLTPVATLVSALFSVGRMSGANEITALKSGGMSLYRFMAPIVVFCLFLSFGQLYFNGWVVPRANEAKFDIEREYLKKRGSNKSIHNLYFRDNPQRNVVMQYYDSKKKAGNYISIEDYSSEKNPRLMSKIEAKQMQWDTLKNEWTLINGIERTYYDGKMQFKNFDTLNIQLRLTHDKVMSLKKQEGEMTFDEMKEYIDLLEKGGKDVGKQRIKYFGNYAFPFANFIVILFGLPFASVKKKGGIAVHIAAAMVISFTYLVFTILSQSLGHAASLNPILAGWMANIIFAIIGLIVLLTTKT